MKNSLYFLILAPSWMFAASFEATSTNSKIALVGHTATTMMNGEVLFCGSESYGNTADCEIYNPQTRDFRYTQSTMNINRSEAAAAVLNDGKVLIAGGITGEGMQTVVTDAVEIFDPVTELFSPAGHMNEARWGGLLLSATNLYGYGYGKVLLLGGGSSNKGEVFDPATGQFTYTGPLADPTNMWINSAVDLHGKVLVVGGQNAVAEIYDPQTNTFALTGSLNQPGYSNNNGDCGQAVRLADDRVLFVGVHFATNATVMFAETYSTATGTFTPIAGPRMRHTNTSLVVLPSGKVLLAGGWSDHGVTSASEIFDPELGTWSDTAAMLGPRAFYSANILNDGTALFVGGMNEGASLLSAETYNP